MKIKKRKTEKSLFCFLLIFFLAILVFLALYFYTISKSASEDIPALSLSNFFETDVGVTAQNILLTAGCYRLTMVTGLEQIQSIAMALENLSMPRPNSHDLFVRSLKNFGISLLFVKIDSLMDGTYYAKLFLKQGNNILILDSRPSDAIAIALRSGSPIYLNEDLLGYAEKIC